jgi:hypothetical protein
MKHPYPSLLYLILGILGVVAVAVFYCIAVALVHYYAEKWYDKKSLYQVSIGLQSQKPWYVRVYDRWEAERRPVGW